jgi:hypothetical protein
MVPVFFFYFKMCKEGRINLHFMSCAINTELRKESMKLLWLRNGTVQEPRGRGMPTIGSCYHMTGEDTAD